MDVLNPELIWIHGRCYRVNFQHSCFREVEEGQFVDDGIGDGSMLSTRIKYIFFLFQVNVHAIAHEGVRCIQGTFIVTKLFGNRGSLHLKVHCILVTDM